MIDLTQPFEVVSFDLRERAALTGDFSLQWVIKIVQREDERAAGCTLLVDAETGIVRYQIEKATGARKRQSDLLKRSGTGVDPAADGAAAARLRLRPEPRRRSWRQRGSTR